MFFAFNQEINLVRDDYYEAELNFNEKVEIVNRTAALPKQLEVKQAVGQIQLIFPPLVIHSKIQGNIKLYRPSDRNLDMDIPIELDLSFSQTINTERMVGGMWKIQIDWMADSVKYFNEEIVMVN